MQFMADLVLTCESCKGKRFKEEVLEIKHRGCDVSDILNMTIEEAIAFFTESAGTTACRLVNRLQPLAEVGLGYVKMGQASSTLSGGESQRVKLDYFLALEKTAPTLFIFDEPTTGLHSHDIAKLLKAFSPFFRKGHPLGGV